MAGVSLLALLDDIAAVLDDIALMSKVAAKKTAGVLGDDLALNAQQVSGVRAERELPVVWAVAVGSAKNKLVLVPAALLISAIAPWAITPLLMLGGAFLCYEGFEKLWHHFSHRQQPDTEQEEIIEALADPATDIVALEKTKIKGAIRTDFILSAEIVVISLGIVQEAPLSTQIATMCVVAAAMTIGVYGLVAGIVKLDDAGLYLLKNAGTNAWGSFKAALGKGILRFCPYLMKGLTIVGTAAMFLVGGGILVHGIPQSHDLMHPIIHAAQGVPYIGDSLSALTPSLVGALVGIVAGGLILAMVSILNAVIAKFKQL
jgi:predicted DNA repair protein MutK